jgi:hypothetical protein
MDAATRGIDPQAFVIVDGEESDRKPKRSGNLAEFFAASPLRGSGLKMRKSKDLLRPPGVTTRSLR